jgi:hypothetical protein
LEIEFKERRRALLLPSASLDARSAYHRASERLLRFSAEHADQTERFLNIAAGLDPNSQAGPFFVHWRRAILETAADRCDETRMTGELINATPALARPLAISRLR